MAAETDDQISPGGVPPTADQRAYVIANLAKAREAKAAKAAAKKAEEAQMVATKKAAGPSSENDGPDLDKVNELIAMYPQVSCDIRHHIGGSWKMTNENYLVETKELLTFTNHLTALEGGGKYSVRVRDPNNLGEMLMPVIKYNINQPPRVAARAPDPWAVGPVAMPIPDFVPTPVPQSAPFTPQPHQEPAPMQPQYPPPGLPMQYRSLPVEQQWNLYYAQSAQRTQGLEPAGQVAMTQVQQLLAEKGRLEASLAGVTARAEADRRALEDKIASVQREQERQLQAERDRANRAEAEAREARHRADMERIQAASDAKFESLKAELVAQRTAPKTEEKKGGGFETLGIFIPVILEWLRANSAKDEAERNRSFENMKLLMASTKRDQSPIEVEMMKSFTEMMKLKGEEKISDAEAKVLMLGAISNFIKEREGDAEPWWLPVVTGMIESAKGIGTAIIASKTQVPGQPALPEGPHQPVIQGTVEVQGEPVNVSVHEQYERQQWEAFLKVDDQAARMTAMAFQSPQMPAAMHTPEWRMLIFNLHARKTDPEKLAELAVNHLENQREFGMLPPTFKAVFETPAPVLELVVKALPIWAVDQAYAQAFLDAAVEEITDREAERKQVEREEAEEAAEETEGEEVKEAPANGN